MFIRSVLVLMSITSKMSVFVNRLLKITQITVRNECHVRKYCRWTHRRPQKVLTEEEFESSHNVNTTPGRDEPNVIELDRFESKRKPVKPKHVFQYKEQGASNYSFDMKDIDRKSFKGTEVGTKQEPKYTEDEVMATTFDECGNYVYEKMRNNDTKIANLMFTVRSKKIRDKKGLILLEGKRLIRDALEVGCVLQYVLFSRKSDLEFVRDLVPENRVKFYKMAYRDMQTWSDLTTTPGIMAIVKTPKIENARSENVLPLTIVCDNVREPGNLGAILRSSAAVGCSNLVLTKGCVDLWEPKVLRSAAGAHFRMSIWKSVLWKNISERLPENSSIFLADNGVVTTTSPNSEVKQMFADVPLVPYFGVRFGDFKNVTLVVGGETQGLSEEAYRLAKERGGLRLNIPLDNGVESLNTGTALAVIAFEMKKQLLTKT